jgi:hypothetical protein
MTAPKRIQRRRTKGWRKPEDAVVVSRPSKWGNRHAVGRCSRVACGGPGWCVSSGVDDPHTRVSDKAEGIRLAVLRYVQDIAADPLRLAWAGMAATELRGKDLACWCPLDQPCHADVLLDIANGGAA